jgi:uncharacterized protein
LVGRSRRQRNSRKAAEAAADGDRELLRLVTHPKMFVNPTPTTEALRFVDVLLAAPGVEQSALGAEWTALRKRCTDKALGANDILDAWLAAAVIHQDEHLVTFDGDFKRLLSRAQFTRLAA